MKTRAGMIRNVAAAAVAVVFGPFIAYLAAFAVAAIDAHSLAIVAALLLAPALLCGLSAYVAGCGWFSTAVAVLASASTYAVLVYIFSHTDWNNVMIG